MVDMPRGGSVMVGHSAVRTRIDAAIRQSRINRFSQKELVNSISVLLLTAHSRSHASLTGLGFIG